MHVSPIASFQKKSSFKAKVNVHCTYVHQFLEVIISEPASFRPKDFSPDAEKSTPFMSCNRGISIITITVNS